MKRRLLGIALLGAALWATAGEAAAFGKKKSSSGDCGYWMTAGYGASYGGHGYDNCSPCGSHGGMTVSYVDQKVTAYKTEWETKDVKVMTTKWVPTKEEYKYYVSQPVVTKQKSMVKEMQTKQEQYNYTVMEWTTVKERVKSAELKPVVKAVEYTTYEMQPVRTKQLQTVCEYVSVPVTMTATVAPQYHAAYAPCASSSAGGRRGLCGKKKGSDCAAPCPPPCGAPSPYAGGCSPCDTAPQVVTYTVMQRQAVTRQVEVDVTTYQRVEKKGVQQVTTYETVWTEKEVNVNKCVPVQKTGTRAVAFYVDVEKVYDVTTYQQVQMTGTREVLKPTQVQKTGTRTVAFYVDVEKVYDVTTYQQVQMTGTREVLKPTQVEETVKQSFPRQVAYETTVKVPVYTPAPAPCDTPCATPYYSPCASPCTTTMTVGRKHCCGK